jgi:hypothetical protein
MNILWKSGGYKMTKIEPQISKISLKMEVNLDFLIKIEPNNRKDWKSLDSFKKKFMKTMYRKLGVQQAKKN